MKAMILAAGLGTRLRPLTDTCPKALVEIAGRTLLEITLSRLRAFGITEAVINVHHFAGLVIDYLKSHRNFGMHIEISIEDVLLDTGGGLRKAAWFFLENSSPANPGRTGPIQADEPFLLHNVDVISNIDFASMLQFHKEHHALATLAVQSRESSRQLLFDNHLRLRGRRSSGTAIPGLAPQSAARPDAPATAKTEEVWPSGRSEESALSESRPEGPSRLQALAFSGIHFISPRLLPMLTEEGIFSIIPAYLRLAGQGENILAFRADEYYWRDLGRPTDLAQAAQDLQQKALL
jgi:NDP-sugar pyrophosphorylase family protein